MHDQSTHDVMICKLLKIQCSNNIRVLDLDHW